MWFIICFCFCGFLALCLLLVIGDIFDLNGYLVSFVWGVILLYIVKWLKHRGVQSRANQAEAYYNSGEISKNGEAVKWYRKAAKLGHAEAQFMLGIMYANGEGVPQDDTKAVKWYRKAAEQGNVTAQYHLGNMYDLGDRVPEDDTEAVKWYRKAAEQGLSDAQGILGLMYANGEGVPQDDTEAVKWYRKAAEQGDVTAQYQLGNMYAWGRGIPQDDVEAYMWVILSASGGLYKGSEKLRTELSRKMSKDQIAEAQAMSRKWLEDFEKKNKE